MKRAAARWPAPWWRRWCYWAGARRLRACVTRRNSPPAQRATSAGRIRTEALEWALGEASREEIDELNILQATLLAMQRAFAGLSRAPARVEVDGNRAPSLPGYAGVIETVVGGDRLRPAIAAASILAKVHRDAVMGRLHLTYPGYGFDRHKGYPTTGAPDGAGRARAVPGPPPQFWPRARRHARWSTPADSAGRQAMTPGFVHLHVHTEYSLVDSVVRVPELVAAAAAAGMPAVAITDQGNLFGLVKFYRAALAAGVQPIVGAEVWLRWRPGQESGRPAGAGAARASVSQPGGLPEPLPAPDAGLAGRPAGWLAPAAPGVAERGHGRGPHCAVGWPRWRARPQPPDRRRGAGRADGRRIPCLVPRRLFRGTAAHRSPAGRRLPPRRRAVRERQRLAGGGDQRRAFPHA